MAEQKSSLDMKERKIAELNAQNQHLIELKESMAKLLGQFGQPNY
jgi:Tfp pilus assembly protein PilO